VLTESEKNKLFPFPLNNKTESELPIEEIDIVQTLSFQLGKIPQEFLGAKCENFLHTNKLY
jgi:hypothetical protein